MNLNNLGVANPYVAAGPTKEERRARLLEVPERLRDDVISHVETVFAMRSRKKKK